MKTIVYFLLFSFTTLGLKAQIDHDQWDQLLQSNVTEKGVVNYEGFKAQRESLKGYLNQLAENPPKENWPRNEKMAFWINAYNAFTVELILKNYPVGSIMKINNGKAWDLQFIEIGGKSYSLNNIEHDILRKRFNDARIHFAVNCASVSCPKLHNRSFKANMLDQQLSQLTKEFVNNKEKNMISSEEVQISKIFSWYAEDFNKNGSLIEFLNKYSDIKIEGDAVINYKDYNWNLNN